ncbi:MAG: histidinol dehydrogenase, partial [Starkeya sp.]|nr:histidinol dehydrogenase [Starkeya sp.]
MSALSSSLRDQIHPLKAPRPDDGRDTNEIAATVKEVLDAVRTRGDEAVRHYSKLFDKSDVTAIEVSAEERAAALAALDPQTRADTEFAIERVRAFAQAQLATILPLEVEALPGLHLGHRVIPIERVG